MHLTCALTLEKVHLYMQIGRILWHVTNFFDWVTNQLQRTNINLFSQLPTFKTKVTNLFN